MKVTIEEWGGDGAIRIPDEVLQAQEDFPTREISFSVGECHFGSCSQANL